MDPPLDSEPGRGVFIYSSAHLSRHSFLPEGGSHIWLPGFSLKEAEQIVDSGELRTRLKAHLLLQGRRRRLAVRDE